MPLEKEWVDINNITKLENNDNNSKDYKVKATCNSTVYIKKSADYIPKLYYLIFE